MVFRLAFFLSLAIHTAVFCSVRHWPGSLSFAVKSTPAAVSLIEVGLIQPAPILSAPAAKEKKSDTRPEEYALKSINKVLPEKSRSDSLSDSRPAPEGRAGTAPQSGGRSSAAELDLIRKKIEAAVYYPPRAKLQRLEGEVKIAFFLSPAGELLHEKVIVPSPYQVLDQAALRILKKAAPFGPIPAELSGKEIPFTIKFKSSY